MLNTLRKFFEILANASEPQIFSNTPTFWTSNHQAEVEDRLARHGLRIERGKPGIPPFRSDVFDHSLRMSRRRRTDADLPTNNAALGYVPDRLSDDWRK
jgi:hypothetical protein